MATDVFVSVCDPLILEKEIESDVNLAFDIFRDFEQRFSRFIEGNELWKYNHTEKNPHISGDLSNMLEKATFYHKFTNGLFDVSVLPNLISEGYPSPTLTEHNKLVDLGGIGKGYIVDKVSAFLRQKYENFLVDAGGDIFCSGKDLVNNYDYWAIEIENPQNQQKSFDTLTLTNMAVATSGINRKKWTKDGASKNHIIDPKTGKSLDNELLTATVVADNTIEADVLAKALLIMGLDKGMRFSEENKIASLFIDKNLNVYKSSKINQYVWQNQR